MTRNCTEAACWSTLIQFYLMQNFLIASLMAKLALTCGGDMHFVKLPFPSWSSRVINEEKFTLLSR
jgi:hypothetical protein